MIVTESNASPSGGIVRLNVKVDFVSFARRRPAYVILAIVLLHRAISRRFPMAPALIIQLMRRRCRLGWLVLVEEIDLCVATLQLMSMVFQLVGLIEFRVR